MTRVIWTQQQTMIRLQITPVRLGDYREEEEKKIWLFVHYALIYTRCVSVPVRLRCVSSPPGAVRRHA